MRQFFRGWKRKVGVVTLVVACLLMVGWVRSLENWESLHLTLLQGKTAVSSVEGRLVICRSPVNIHFGMFEWITLSTASVFGPGNGSLRPVDASTLFNVHQGNGNEFLWRWQFFGFDCGVIVPGSDSTLRIRYIFVPYWSVVVPLTLLSAYLLFSEPRPAKKTETATATTGN
jgi:hypothetical protein